MKNEDKYFCKRCHRPLKDKFSIKVGYGPCCIQKINPKNKSIFDLPPSEIKLQTDSSNVKVTDKKVREVKEVFSGKLKDILKKSNSISIKDNTLSIKLEDKQTKEIEEELKNILEN